MVKTNDPFDPFLCFVNARAMHLSSFAIEQFVESQPAIRHIMFWPEMVMEAFGLELHLKCLHALRGRFDGGHGIKELYDNLDPDDRAGIQTRFAELMAINPHYADADVQRRGTLLDMESVVIRADEMFYKGRYWHEGLLPRQDSRGHIGDAGTAVLSDAIFELLLAVKPEWWKMLTQFRINGLDDGTQST